jgi:hypothetical protein
MTRTCLALARGADIGRHAAASDQGSSHDPAGPVVAPIFQEYVASHGLQDRLRFAALDFFREPIPKADVVIMGHILHDWDLPTKRTLVAKAYDALPAGGAFIVFEARIDDDRRANAFGLLMSLNMLIETQGGLDYTGADCATWMRGAGFRQTRVEHLSGPDFDGGRRIDEIANVSQAANVRRC